MAMLRNAAPVILVLLVGGLAGCGDAGSDASVHAEITRCYATSEAAPAADVSLSVANPPSADPSYTVYVIFEATDPLGPPLETAGTTLTLLGTTEAHDTVSLLGADYLAGEPVTCAIDYVEHLEYRDGEEVGTKVQGRGPQSPQS